MCSRCRTEANGQRSGKGSALLSTYVLGMRACKHEEDCLCEDCQAYRERNQYSDTGLFS